MVCVGVQVCGVCDIIFVLEVIVGLMWVDGGFLYVFVLL